MLTPLDFSKANLADIQKRVTKLRLAVYEALLKHGPCTTRELATAMERDLLTVRPRVTELLELGLVALVGDERTHEGTYRALTWSEAAALQETQKRQPQPAEQLLMGKV